MLQQKLLNTAAGSVQNGNVTAYDSAAPPAEQAAKASESKQVKRALKSILTAQDEVWGILRENTRLIEQFGQLAVVAATTNTANSNSSLEGHLDYENGYD